MSLRPFWCIPFILLTGFAQPKPSVSDAVHKGHGVGREQEGIAAVRETLAAGGDVNERDKSGWTPLMHAALECRPGIAKVLLEHGANVAVRGINAKTNSFMDRGQNALILASSCFIARRRAVVASERGRSQDEIQSELAAPAEFIRLLIRRGADVNASNADGQTALMMASMQGWSTVVEALIGANANISSRDAEDRLAIDYADPEDSAVLKLLHSAGSLPPTGKSGRTVCDAERALDKLGYGATIMDCISGDQLKTVILKFQADRELPQTGKLDTTTRNELKIR
jgi:ankyrin repeat protein